MRGGEERNFNREFRAGSTRIVCLAAIVDRPTDRSTVKFVQPHGATRPIIAVGVAVVDKRRGTRSLQRACVRADAKVRPLSWHLR